MDNSETTPTPQSTGNGSGLLLVILLLIWTSVGSFLTHAIAWGLEQILIASGVSWPSWAWPLIMAIQGLLLLIPLLPLAWFWRAPRYRAVFQTWAAAAVFIFFFIPIRFLMPTDAFLPTVLQIVATLLYIALIVFIIRRRQQRGDPGLVRPQGPYLPALLLGALLTYGWLVWGALGSWLDILVNLVAALLFGVAAGLVIAHFLLEPLRRTAAGSNMVLEGFVIGATLVMMGSAFGFKGMQLHLTVALPAAAWMAAAVTRFGRRPGASAWLSLALFTGLAAAAPLLFLDPDELVLILSLGPRDIWIWSLYALVTTLLTGWAAGLVLVLLRQRLPAWQGRSWQAVAAVAAWLVAILLYAGVGQPGLYGEHLFVILEAQADVSTAVSISDPNERRQIVYDTLVNHADTTQADLRVTLDRLGIDYTPYYLVNAIDVEAGPLVRLWLNSRPDVGRILNNPVLRPLPAPAPPVRGNQGPPSTPPWNLTAIGASRVWEELGVTGEGITIGQSDSGVQGDHPEVAAAYRGSDGSHDYNWFDPWYHTAEPTDVSGHGTHTLGSILGQNVGVAPGATWYGCVNLRRNLGNPAFYLDCMQFMLAPFPQGGDPLRDGQPSRGAHVSNNSWGCPDIEGCDPNALVTAVGALRAAGVFVVASAGNDGIGGCNTVEDPIALYDEVFTVGAINEAGRVTEFSSRGPVTVDGSNRTKPDIVAPGAAILSANPGNTYAFSEGTSMAGPHVVGVVALMWSANPDLIGEIDLTEMILIETATPYPYDQLDTPACGDRSQTPDNAVGYGIVDAYAAVQRALQMGR